MCKSSFSPVPFSFLSVFYSARTNLRCAGSGRYGSSAARAGAANRLRGRNRGTDAPSTAAGSCPGAPNPHLLVFIGLAGSTKSFDRAEFASGGRKSASGGSQCPEDRHLVATAVRPWNGYEKHSERRRCGMQPEIMRMPAPARLNLSMPLIHCLPAAATK